MYHYVNWLYTIISSMSFTHHDALKRIFLYIIYTPQYIEKYLSQMRAVRKYIHTYMHTYACSHTRIHIRTYSRTCIYTCIYIHTYIHTHTHIYTCMHRSCTKEMSGYFAREKTSLPPVSLCRSKSWMQPNAWSFPWQVCYTCVYYMYIYIYIYIHT
jgi:hypothetical protein